MYLQIPVDTELEFAAYAAKFCSLSGPRGITWSGKWDNLRPMDILCESEALRNKLEW